MTKSLRLQALEKGTFIAPLIRKPLDPVWMKNYDVYGGGVYVSYNNSLGFGSWKFSPKKSRCKPRLGPHPKKIS